MAEKLFLEVDIDGKALTSVRSLSISQGIYGHHHFHLSIPAESIDKEIDAVFDQIPSMIGSEVRIDWETGSFKSESTGDDFNNFKGLVTDVQVSGDRAEHMIVTIHGSSPTILIDGVKGCEAYSEMDVSEIYGTAVQSDLTESISIVDNISFKDKIPFICQYQETDFEFISRVMYACGEWFFYDGKNLNLGLAHGSPISITKDRLFSISYDFNVKSPAPQMKGRDYIADKVVELASEEVSREDQMASGLSSGAYGLYPSHSKDFVNMPSFAEGESDQYSKELRDKMLMHSRQSRSYDGFTVTGVSDMAQLQVGSVIKLEDTAYKGDYVICHIDHECGGKDNYSNRFRAVPVDSANPPLSHPLKEPRLGDSVALVVDNKDPEKMGRLKVRFDWAKSDSPWLRMVMPYTGSGRGFYFVPEEGEEVMVGFEDGRSTSPFIIGSLYNGKNKYDTHYKDDNKIKAIKTLSGNEIIFNDNGSLTIHNGKNSMVLSCKDDGELRIATDGKMVLESAKDMEITCGENLMINVGKDMELNVGDNQAVSVGQDREVTTGMNMILSGGTNTEITAGASLKLEGMETSVTGQQTTVEGMAMSEFKSSGITTVKGSLVKIN